MGQNSGHELISLHLGAGRRQLRGWYQMDISSGAHIDFVGSVSDLHMFSDGSVGEIYASHLLEYFDWDEARETLREWKRVLCSPGGNLYIAVPDFDSLLSIYAQTKNLKSIIGPLFGKMPSDLGTIYHKSVFDRETLVEILHEVGFSEVEEYNPIDFLAEVDPNYDDHSLAFYPHMDRSGIQVSLCLRAYNSN